MCRSNGSDSRTASMRGPELLVVHERDEIGVVEQVPQLGFDVAVVDVDRDRAQLVRGEDRLDELVAVERVDADVVAGPDALRGEMVREPVRVRFELARTSAHDRRR